MFYAAEWRSIAPHGPVQCIDSYLDTFMAKHILLVDSHEIVRIGLAQIIAGCDIEMTQVATATEANVKMETGVFELLLVDVRLPSDDVFQFITSIKQRLLLQNILLFTSMESATFLPKAISIGVNGMISKSESAATILDAIQRTIAGESLWTKDEIKKAAAGGNGVETLSGVPLTAREIEVLQKLTSGLTNREIAQSLGISYETVKEHVQHILRKVGVSDRTQAAVWAVRNNLV
jgi:DNA-binding NarL/FixJ family response regulator